MKLSRAYEPFKEILTGRSIRRWAHVFPRSDFLCIPQLEATSAKTILRLNAFLGVNISTETLGVENMTKDLAVTSLEASELEKYDAIIQSSPKSNHSQEISIRAYANIIIKYDLPDEVAKVC